MKRYITLMVFLLFAFACREKYVPDFDTPATGYLIVEGNINSGDTTIISLSRSNTLDATGVVWEAGATVQVESSTNIVFRLLEYTTGRYRAVLPSLSASQQYRLHIYTIDGKEYLSAYTNFKQTPAIDSITWRRESGDAVQMYVNAHDDANASQYYIWDYLETWEFRSGYFPDLGYNTINPNRVLIQTISQDTLKYKCWNNRRSSEILVGTTVNLAKDRVYYPIKFVPRAAREMSVLYSILVKQYVLSKEAYEFYEKLKKNTETTGSIFDAQPSNITGNITCVNSPTDIVIGFVNVSSVERKRLFIYNYELPGWNYRSDCQQMDYPNHPDSIMQAYRAGVLPITTAELVGTTITRWFGTLQPSCVDCTLTGSNARPAFWP